MTLCDAHNHLHFPEFRENLAEIVAAMREAGVDHCVVNGTCEADWPEVARVAREFPDFAIPAFGLHPWKIAERTPEWRERLADWLKEFPQAGIGECGLDQAMKDPDPEAQAEAFRSQLELARALDRPVTVHCVRAWGPLLDILGSERLPERGLVLHDFSGTPELVKQLAKFPVAFSFSAAALHPSREKVRRAFAEVPEDRLLLETDAPNLPPPPSQRSHELADPAVNHPANLTAVTTELAPLRDLEPVDLAALTTRNFRDWFVTNPD